MTPPDLTPPGGGSGPFIPRRASGRRPVARPKANAGGARFNSEDPRLPEIIRLTLPLPPSANDYWRHTIYKGRPLVHLTSSAKAYRKRVELFVLAQFGKRPPLTGRLSVRMTVYFPTLAGDLANREKQLSDALQGRLFVNDSQIWRLTMIRRLDRGRPRVELAVADLDRQGDL